MKKGFTLIEVVVSLMILLTLAGLLVSAMLPARSKNSNPQKTYLLQTVLHDGHKWVLAWSAHGKAFVHHPDCQCQGRNAEQP